MVCYVPVTDGDHRRPPTKRHVHIQTVQEHARGTRAVHSQLLQPYGQTVSMVLSLDLKLLQESMHI